MTRNDGAEWKKRDEGLPRKWVTRIVAWEHDLGTAYLSMSGYREDDFKAHLFRSTDFGATWTSIAANLPAEPINVVREDPRRPDILYVGTDAGVYMSLDRGASWLLLCADLPTTPVMDMVVHPREDELIIATHGRSMFLLDVRPIQAMTGEVSSAAPRLFDLRPVVLKWQVGREVAPNPPRGRARIHYWVGAAGPVSIAIRNANGETAHTLTVRAAAGLNRTDWDVRLSDGHDAKPGVYRVEVSSEGRRVSGELVVRPGR